MGANRGGRGTFGDVGESRAGSGTGKTWGRWVFPSLHFGTPTPPPCTFSLHFPLFSHPFPDWALPPCPGQATLTRSCDSLGWFGWGLSGTKVSDYKKELEEDKGFLLQPLSCVSLPASLRVIPGTSSGALSCTQIPALPSPSRTVGTPCPTPAWGGNITSHHSSKEGTESRDVAAVAVFLLSPELFSFLSLQPEMGMIFFGLL